MSTTVTLLWFGAEAFALRDSELVALPLPERGDPAAALVSALEKFDPKPKAVQLIYQPSGLDPVSTQTTSGSRQVMARTLASEHPGLTSPNSSWSALAPLPFEGGYTTLLFIEPRPRIQRFQTALAEAGITLRGAWPLPALLETIPPFNAGGTTGIFLVCTETTALVYALLPNAARHFTIVNDVAAPQAAILALNTCLTYFDRDLAPPVHTVALDRPWHLGDDFSAITPVNHQLADMLAHAVDLKSRASSNFAPPELALPWNRILQGGAVAALLFAFASAAVYYHDLRKLTEDQAKRSQIATSLAADVAKLRDNRAKIEQAQAFAAEIPENQVAPGRLLDVLVKATPAGITLHRLVVHDGNFVLEGTLHDGVSTDKGPFADFHAALSRPDLPWTLTDDKHVSATADFTLSGTFR